MPLLIWSLVLIWCEGFGATSCTVTTLPYRYNFYDRCIIDAREAQVQGFHRSFCVHNSEN